MQTIYKWLVPGFLRRWDTWLLERYPIVWRTRGHYVMFYALVAIPVLFALGFFYPVSATDLTVDPIRPIILNCEILYNIPLGALSLGVLYWGYTQYQMGFPSVKPKHVLLTLLIYSVCLFAIIATTAPAFYLGAIVRTGYFLMEEADIKYWEDNGSFLYGFVLKESYDPYVEADDTFFHEREASFKRLWRGEEYILTNRYNNDVVDSFVHLKVMSDRSYWSYQSNLLDRSDLLLPSDPSDQMYVSRRLYRSDPRYNVYLSNLSYLSDYWLYYERTRLPKINTTILEKYQIPILNDSIAMDSSMFIYPDYIYYMEDAIRSVHHAQQYINEGIIFRHWRMLVCFLPLLALLLFAAPYLTFRYSLAVVILGGIGGTGLLTVFELDKLFSEEECSRNAYAYLALPLTGLLILALSAFRKKRAGYMLMAVHLVVLGLASVLFFAIMGSEWAFAEYSLSMGKPVDLAFFGVQVIGLAGVLLMAYLQALPRRG